RVDLPGPAFCRPDGSTRATAIAYPPQYGGGLRARCVLAASLHQKRSSAKRGNAWSSDDPAAPTGLPSAVNASAIGPTWSVLEITIMPISDNVPCQSRADRAPAIRPAE